MTVTGSILSVCAVLLATPSTGQQAQNGTHAVKLSTLPTAQQLSINAAIKQWDRQFKWKAQDSSDNLIGDASVETVHLGPSGENDFVITDQAGCSPTGNCSILILRPIKGRYLVVLDGIGQMFRIKQGQTNGFHNVELKMHGSATTSEIKIYKFNGSRYLRSGCYEVNFTAFDKDGNIQELDKPQITPCVRAVAHPRVARK